MKIPDNLIDIIRNMSDDNTDFYNIEWHKDNKVFINFRLLNEKFARRYSFYINPDDGTVSELDLEFTLPDRNDITFWHDNGYPLQGNSAYITLDPIIKILGKDNIELESQNADLRLLNRIHCTYDHGFVTIEVATKPAIETVLKLKFTKRSN